MLYAELPVVFWITGSFVLFIKSLIKIFIERNRIKRIIFPPKHNCATIKNRKKDISMERQVKQMFLLLGGGLLIILFAVIVAVVSSVVSAVAAVESDSED